MANLNITQTEAEILIAMEKHRMDDIKRRFMPGLSVGVPLVSADKREEFILDITKGRIDLSRCRYQTRAHKTIVLLRLEMGTHPHRNPDGEEIGCPHLHIYRENYGDKWAIPLPQDFSDTKDLFLTLEEFMRYCNITNPPFFERGILT